MNASFVLCRPLVLLTLCCLTFHSLAASDDAVCVKSDMLCREVGSWEVSIALGVGGRTNPLISGDDQPVFVVPQLSWYGKRFFLENLEFGFTLLDKPAHMLNLLVQPGFDQVYFDEFGIGNFTIDGNFSTTFSGADSYGYVRVDDSLIDGESIDPGFVPETPQDTDRPATNVRLNLDDLKDRDLAVLGGLEYSFYSGAWQTQLQLLRDVSGVHEGDEVRLSTAWQVVRGRNLYTLAAGLAWQSQELLDYYYGIDQGEIPNSDLSYEAQAGVSAFAKFSWQKKLNEKWSLLSTVHYRELDSSLESSPIVEETGVTTVFIGGSYHF